MAGAREGAEPRANTGRWTGCAKSRSPRNCPYVVGVLCLGILLEAVAIAGNFLWDHHAFDASLSMAAAALVAASFLVLAYLHGVHRSATLMAACSGGLFLVYKGINLWATVWPGPVGSFWESGGAELEAFQNMLLLGSGMVMLLTCAQTIVTLHRTNAALLDRNAALETEQRQTERAESQLRRGKRVQEALLDAVSDALVLTERNGTIRALNTTAEAAFGRPRDALIGARAQTLYPPAAAAAFVAQAQRVVETGAAASGEYAHGGRSYETTVYPVRGRDGGVSGFAALSRDVTARIAAEQARRLLETAVESAAESIVITDVHGAIEYVNPAFERQTGYARGEALRKNPRVLRSGKHSRKFYERLWRTLLAGEVWEGHFINRRKDGVLFEEEATIAPIRDAAGAITHFVAVKRDVTREVEMRRQLDHAGKMEALGTLAGGIAHDFNAVLALVLGHAGLALEMLEPGHAASTHLEVIQRSAGRSSELIRQLLTFSRYGGDGAGPLPIAPIVREAVAMMRAYLPASIAIGENIAGDAGAAVAEPGGLQQAVINLCTNAWHALEPKGGAIGVALECVTVDADFRPAAGEAPPGAYVRLTVSDDGCGMDANTMRRMFDPFFTTKPQGKGSGLGLSTVHGAVLGWRGAIDAASAPGQGSRIAIYLPRVDPPAPAAARPAHGAAAVHGAVLVVDDSEDFAALVEQLLRRRGYRVCVHNDPAAALAHLAGNPGDFDALVTDYRMPGMTGGTLLERARALRPALRAVLVTGCSDAISEAAARALGFDRLLYKPVSPRALFDALAADDAEPAAAAGAAGCGATEAGPTPRPDA